MKLPPLKNESDKSLLNKLSCLKKLEDNSIADFIVYLSEVDIRKIYRELGFSSLFSYLTQGLGYSEASAYRRIQAARSLKDNPEIYELLREGKLTLCAVSEIARVIKPENKEELLNSSQGKAKIEVKKITAKYQEPRAPLKKEKIVAKKVIVEKSAPLFSQTLETKEETRFTFTVEVDEEFMELLKEAKALVGPKPTVEVLRKTLKEFIDRKKALPRKVKEVKVGNNTRYIPRSVAHQVKTRDKHRCSFVSHDGRRCSETCGLEIDHVQPYSLGGNNEASNLRLLCKTHNLYFAEKTFGKQKIQSHFIR